MSPDNGSNEEGPIRLTRLAHGAGCACKLSMGELGELLSLLPGGLNPNVLVDASTRDDAAVFDLGGDRLLVATVDFFPPIVDDPFDFGRIAATNALSDLYAMGARPLFALNLLGFPRALLHSGMGGEILRGGGAVAAAAGIGILGGHSIDDAEPKYGLVALGEVTRDALTTNAGARPGDRLILSKAIGTGVITTAARRDDAPPGALPAAVSSMTELNARTADDARAAGVSGVTDVTGFGLLGHLHGMLLASGCSARIDAEALPLLEGARECVARGHVPGGSRRNHDHLAPVVDWDPAVDPTLRILACDAQTSGGLLLAVHPSEADGLLRRLRLHSPDSAVVGEILPGEAGRISVG